MSESETKPPLLKLLPFLCKHCREVTLPSCPSIRYCSQECRRAAWDDARAAAKKLDIDLALPATPPYARVHGRENLISMDEVCNMDLDEWVREQMDDPPITAVPLEGDWE